MFVDYLILLYFDPNFIIIFVGIYSIEQPLQLYLVNLGSVIYFSMHLNLI